MSTLSDKKTANQLSLLLISIILGAAAGAVVWLFLIIMSAGMSLVWDILPAYINLSVYPLLACTLGGVIVGISLKLIGSYPEELETVIDKVKQSGRYDACRIWKVLIAALLPLIFGASLGPEAGLAGVIALLCTWVGDRMKYVLKEESDMAQIGIAAALSILFAAPLFGFMAQVEDADGKTTFPKRQKVIAYLAAILAAFGVSYMLVESLGGGLHIERFGPASMSRHEILWFIPIALIGTLAGIGYNLLGAAFTRLTMPLKKYNSILAILGGIILGLFAIYVPYSLFSGELETGEIMAGYQAMAPWLLIGIGVMKILITNICLAAHWRGGHIFPTIFAGISMGYGVAGLCGVDPVFAVAATTTALCGAVMKKPLAVILVMLIFFPFKDIILLTAAAFIGASLSPGAKKEAKGWKKKKNSVSGRQ